MKDCFCGKHLVYSDTEILYIPARLVTDAYVEEMNELHNVQGCLVYHDKDAPRCA